MIARRSFGTTEIRMHTMTERPLRKRRVHLEGAQDTGRVRYALQRGRPRKDFKKECLFLYPQFCETCPGLRSGNWIPPYQVRGRLVKPGMTITIIRLGRLRANDQRVKG